MIKRTYRENIEVTSKDDENQLLLSFTWLSKLGFAEGEIVKLEASPKQIILYLPYTSEEVDGQLEKNNKIFAVHKWVRSCEDPVISDFLAERDVSFYITSILYEFIDLLIERKFLS